MRRVMTAATLAVLLLGLAIAGKPHPAFAASYDGNWSVLIITEQGSCDRGYRYDVNVANGRVRYNGEAAINLAGTVAPSGMVSVSIKLGDKGASGVGRLSSTGAGYGSWRGIGSSTTCSGRWEAERR